MGPFRTECFVALEGVLKLRAAPIALPAIGQGTLSVGKSIPNRISAIVPAARPVKTAETIPTLQRPPGHRAASHA